MKISDKIIVQKTKKFDDLFVKLSDYISEDKKILIAVSGGPDSMFLSVLVYNFFVSQKLSLDNLFFVHCNHKTRLETDDEQKFVEEFLEWLKLSVCVWGNEKLDYNTVTSFGSQWQIKKSEQDLRVWRYSEFQKIIDNENIDIVLTGHNLTDRIESSFMNMFSRSGLNWFMYMIFLDQNSLLNWVKILRPLLDFSKSEIEWYCKEYNIWFIVDPTNLDTETSVRNDIRLSLLPQFAEFSNKKTDTNNTFFDSMRQIYFELEEKENSDIGSLLKIKVSEYRNSEFAFLWDIPLWFVSQDVLLKVLKKFNISGEVNKETLKDFVRFFNTAEQGYKYVNWVYFFLSHGKIYIIKAKQNFWEKYIEKTEIIDKLWKVNIGKEVVNIEDEDLVWLEIRYPKEGDKFGSKSWSKYCINQKIPMFWRNFIPVVVEWKNIVKHFY